MILIKIIGKRINYIDKQGKKHSETWGLFECPVCHRQLEKPLSKGKKIKTCTKCKSITHNESYTKLHYVWQAMKQRCENPNNAKYHIYGGAGIKVCDAWQSYEQFKADNPEYKEGLTIDRIDPTKGYCPENVRWVPKSLNSSWTRKRKQVNQYRLGDTPNEKILIKTWESARQAALALGLTANHITRCCSGKSKTHGGYFWEYSDI